MLRLLHIVLARDGAVCSAMFDQLVLEPATIEGRPLSRVQVTIHKRLNSGVIHGIADTLSKPAADVSVVMAVHDDDPIGLKNLSPQLQSDKLLLGDPTAHSGIDDSVLDILLQTVQVKLH